MVVQIERIYILYNTELDRISSSGGHVDAEKKQ